IPTHERRPTMVTKLIVGLLAVVGLGVAGVVWASSGTPASVSCCAPGAACCPGPCCDTPAPAGVKPSCCAPGAARCPAPCCDHEVDAIVKASEECCTPGAPCCPAACCPGPCCATAAK